MPEYFRAGKPCMCVNGGPWGLSETDADYYGPSKHQQVTIKHIYGFNGHLVLTFVEFPSHEGGESECCYGAENFRPVSGTIDTASFRKTIYEQDRLMKPGGVGA